MAKASGTKKSAPSSKKKPAKGKPAPAKPKKPAAKAASKPAPKKAAATKSEAARTPAPAKPAPVAAAPAPAGVVDPKKLPPKGITIVPPKQIRKAKPKVKAVLPVAEPLLKPGQKWKPLIPSGPKAPPVSTGLGAAAGGIDGGKGKGPRLGKRELDKYKAILLRKRSELVGDISNMEEEALRQNSGSLSSLPQHMAEQGSDNFEQSLSLDLAQVDRNLLREIDAALKRIDDGTYGICELTGKPIAPERLEELPWARYSIEAARELERRPYLVQGGASAAAQASAASDSGGDD